MGPNAAAPPPPAANGATAADGAAAPPEVVALVPSAIVDHVCQVDAAALAAILGDSEPGGSRRVDAAEAGRLLKVGGGGRVDTPGGSAPNVARGLAGLGARAALVGARGADAAGELWAASMARAGVDASRVTPRAGATGCCVILSVGRERTMRTCLEGAARMDVSEVDSVTFAGARFAFLSAYLLYAPGLLEAAAAAARAAGARVALDLGSFEVVRAFLPQLAALLDAGAIDVVFCNEEEAAEIARGLARPDADGDSAADGGADGGAAAPAAALALLAARARELAVVTLGAAGCLVQPRGGAAAIARPAHPVDAVRDTTGAGDLFAAGFLRALLCGAAPADAADAGCLAGAAVVRTVGAEMAPEDWAWLRSRAGAAAK